MEQRVAVDVLICGAGAAGLMLAIELARRGVSFRLIEKSDRPFHGSRGKGIQPRTQEMFEDIGILDRIAAVGGAYPPERRYHEDGSYVDSPAVTHAQPTPSEPYSSTLMVPQFQTERVMRERLLEFGYSPEYGAELVGFEQDLTGVTARVASATGEHTLRAGWLVGADGGRSLVRHILDIAFPGKTLGVRALVADTLIPGLSHDYWHRFNEGDMARQISLCPLAGTRMFQIQGPIPMEGDVDLSAEGLTALLTRRTGRDDIRVESVSWSSQYMMNARLADQYRAGRVFLVGDAAHIHPPTGGQGLNTSVQDAYNLGWKFAAVLKGAAQTLLDSYEEERRPVAAFMLGLATRLLDAQKKGVMERGREVLQLDLNYRLSTLAVQALRDDDGLSAGDRAPDAPIMGEDGQPLRLFDLYRGVHWTLLGYGLRAGSLPARPGLHIHTFGPRGDLFDDHRHFCNAYAPADSEWILVRPDGYIGARVSGQDTKALESYLCRVGLEAVKA